MPTRTATAADLGDCRYFALCDRPAEGLVDTGIADLGVSGYVPCCTRCADRVGATLIPLSEIEIEESS
jgi:hypothetical protein